MKIEAQYIEEIETRHLLEGQYISDLVVSTTKSHVYVSARVGKYITRLEFCPGREKSALLSFLYIGDLIKEGKSMNNHQMKITAQHIEEIEKFLAGEIQHVMGHASSKGVRYLVREKDNFNTLQVDFWLDTPKPIFTWLQAYSRHTLVNLHHLHP